MSERKCLKEFVEQLTECVKDLVGVVQGHEKRIQKLERKADRPLKEAEGGLKAKREGSK
jgi:hypothetical protein